MKLTKKMRAAPPVIASLIVGLAMTHFIISRSGMMPYWMDIAIRGLLEFFGNDSPAPEDIIDLSMLGMLIMCWAVALLFVLSIARIARQFAWPAALTLAFALVSFFASLRLAEWIYDVFRAPDNERALSDLFFRLRDHIAPFIGEPSDLEPLYLPALVLTCWLVILTIFLCFTLLLRLKKTQTTR